MKILHKNKISVNVRQQNFYKNPARKRVQKLSEENGWKWAGKDNRRAQHKENCSQMHPRLQNVITTRKIKRDGSSVFRLGAVTMRVVHHTSLCAHLSLSLKACTWYHDALYTWTLGHCPLCSEPCLSFSLLLSHLYGSYNIELLFLMRSRVVRLLRVYTALCASHRDRSG